MPSSFDVEATATSGRAQWSAIWTRAHCEQLVHDQLAARQLDVFLPKITVWSRRAGIQHLIQVPMFPGYVFLSSVADKASYIEVLKVRGVTRILGERWDRPAVIDDEEIAMVQRLVAAKVPVLAHSYLQEGHRVRIIDGPLTDVEGILVQSKPQKGLLVVSVNLLRRSVAVEINCTAVVPTGCRPPASAMAYAAAC
jgi:transcription termination/antitermination protein NusG